MDAALAESLIHCRRPHRVLGRRLRPFCLWHSFLLEWADSPLSGAESPIGGYTALAVAARICERGKEPYRAPRGVALWGHRLLARVYARQPRALAAQYDAWRAYRADYVAPPRFWRSARSRPAKTPWQLFLVCRLMRGGLAVREAWELPLGAGSGFR